MYYIYHIPGVKIGCSIQPKIRVKAQGYTQYDILEEHNNKKIAAYREVELQKKYGYLIDDCKYDETDYSSMGVKGGNRSKALGHVKKWQEIGSSIASKLSRSEKQIESFKKYQGIGKDVSAKLSRSEKQIESFRRVQKIGSPIGAKISANIIKEKYGIKLQVNLKSDNSFVGFYDSKAECSRCLNINSRDITNCLNPHKKQYSTKGYTFKYKEI